MSNLLRYCVPFLLFILGGSIGLREFTELRYRYKNLNDYNIRDDIKKEGIEMKKPEEVTLENEYEKLQKIDLDNWKNVRIPRPWEE